MPRGKSNQNGGRSNRGGERSGDGRQNVSSRRGLNAMDVETQRRIPAKGSRTSHGGRRSVEESDRSE